MGIIFNILISAIVGSVSAFGFFSFVPLSFIDKFSVDSGQKLGSSITVIQGTDTISNSRGTINTNFSNLNNDKIENSTTSVASITTLSNLVTVGTLTSGALGSGFTAINVAQGGTGSTTLSANQVLLGNGTGAITIVQGWGSSGQFLGSNGGSLAPTWQSAATDQTANYVWTGNHNFTGTTSIKNFNASSTAANPMIWNGVSFNTPSTQGSADTFLKNDGTGSLTWSSPPWALVASTTATAATSSITLTIPSPIRHDIEIACNFPNVDNDTSDIQVVLNNITAGTPWGVKLRQNFTEVISTTASSTIEVLDTASTVRSDGMLFFHIKNASYTGFNTFMTWDGVIRDNSSAPESVNGVAIRSSTILVEQFQVRMTGDTWPAGAACSAYAIDK